MRACDADNRALIGCNLMRDSFDGSFIRDGMKIPWFNAWWTIIDDDWRKGKLPSFIARTFSAPSSSEI